MSDDNELLEVARAVGVVRRPRVALALLAFQVATSAELDEHLAALAGCSTSGGRQMSRRRRRRYSTIPDPTGEAAVGRVERSRVPQGRVAPTSLLMAMVRARERRPRLARATPPTTA